MKEATNVQWKDPARLDWWYKNTCMPVSMYPRGVFNIAGDQIRPTAADEDNSISGTQSALLTAQHQVEYDRSTADIFAILHPTTEKPQE